MAEAQKSGSSRKLLARLHALRDAGDGDALDVLSVVYQEGLRAHDGRSLIQQDSRLAVQYREMGAALGNPPAMTMLADDLILSTSARSRARAVSLYKAAAMRGYSTAAYNLAVSYLRDGAHPKAVTWFRSAASLGDDSAKCQLALAQFHGLGVRRNPSAAIRTLLRLARAAASQISDSEREHCMLFVANALREGWAVRRDYSRALGLFREAADMGSEAARGMLSDLGAE